MSFKEKTEYDKLEKEIAALEEEKSLIEQQLSSNTVAHDKIIRLSEELANILHEIEGKTVRWMELAESL